MVIKGKDGKIQKLPRGGDARYLLAVDAILSADLGAKVKAGDVIARIPTESAKTRDITGGLPRVAELFEARRPRRRRSSPKSPVLCNSAVITRTSAGSALSRTIRMPSPRST
jgi:hypothetical protein